MWLYLTNQTPPPVDGDPVDPALIQQVLDLLDGLVIDTEWRLATDHLRHQQGVDDRLDYSIFRTRLEHLLVRGDAYPQHLHAQLRELFGPFSAGLQSRIGFGIDEALLLARSTLDAVARSAEQV